MVEREGNRKACPPSGFGEAGGPSETPENKQAGEQTNRQTANKQANLNSVVWVAMRWRGLQSAQSNMGWTIATHDNAARRSLLYILLYLSPSPSPSLFPCGPKEPDRASVG